MEQIYVQGNKHFEVYTTVFSPQACRARLKKEEGERVVVTSNYRPQWQDELGLSQGDVILVLFRQDQSWWFGRLQNGAEGYFPTACIARLGQQSEEPVKASPSLLRRSSVQDAGPDGHCGCSGSPGLLHRMLSKSRRKTYPQGALAPAHGSTNDAFLPD